VARPRVIVLTGYGINCDEETAFAFKQAKARADIVHVNDLIEGGKKLADYQVLSFPGGFSYGDDTGSGNALASRIRNNLGQELLDFVSRDRLVLGICNGFQVMVNLGLLPALSGKFGKTEVALAHNDSARYECRWVDLGTASEKCVFTRGLAGMRVPIAHGEGKFYAADAVLKRLEKVGQVVFRYLGPNGQPAKGEFPYNPNGAANDIAGISDPSGRLLGMMPHPERSIHYTQLDDWTLRKEASRRGGKKLPQEGEGLMIFKNAVKYFA
jgi:phosphoribosylformylglycinamidine synthase I